MWTLSRFLMLLSYFMSPTHKFNIGSWGPGVIRTQFMKNKNLEKQHLLYNKVLAALVQILSGRNITARQLPPIFWSNWWSNSHIKSIRLPSTLHFPNQKCSHSSEAVGTNFFTNIFSLQTQTYTQLLTRTLGKLYSVWCCKLWYQSEQWTVNSNREHFESNVWW